MIGIAIPLHLRGGDGAHVAPNLKYLESIPFVQVVVCGSEGKHSRDFALKYDMHYAEVPQGPLCRLSGGTPELRKKYNDSLQALQDIGTFRWYCLVGANDIVSREFWEWLNFRRDDYAMAGVGFDNPYLMTEGNRNVQVKVKYPGWGVQLLPGVNAFSAAYMDKCDWRPYQKPFDEVGAEILARELYTPIVPGPGWVWAVKSKYDLNTFDHIVGRHQVKDIAEPLRSEVFKAAGLKI
jgi:hypothetical protein